MKYAEILDELNRADMSALPKMNLSVLRNVMLEPIEPYLRHHAYRMGYDARIRFGEYDHVFQEAVGGDRTLLNKETDCILVLTHLRVLAPELQYRFAALGREEVGSEVGRIKEFIESVIIGIRRQTDGMILWFGFETPVYPCLGVFDNQMEEGQSGTVRGLNGFLRDRLRQTPNAYFVDGDQCLARVGERAFYDHRYWHIGRALYTREALREMAFEVFKFARPLKGKNRKCLILDCDDTLWGGIIGEDGISGIKLDKVYPGSEYHEFQLEVLNLYHRGVILGLCSKNNEEDVWEVFRKHPHMVLKEEHIAAAQINWRDKASNIRQIALDLNIGLDSLVYVDDSEFEIELVRRELPGVETILVPKGKGIEYRRMLQSCGLFDTLTVSSEDKGRGSMYRAEINRKRLKDRATDLASYYMSLEMAVDVRFADEFSIPRIAQMTQKTNQFNLTTRRYSEADIASRVKSEDSDVIFLKLRDRFGDSGIVGACILKYGGDRAVIDTFLLSCRVLGRGVEDVFLTHALKLAKKKGKKIAVGEYYATAKNAQVEDFYDRQGFRKAESGSPGSHKVYEFDLGWEIREEPDYFKEIHSEIARGEDE